MNAIVNGRREGKAVTAATVAANGFYNIFTGRKRWTIECGECNHTWIEKVPLSERCSAICPCCRTQNMWSSIAWHEQYEKELERNAQ